MGVGPHKVAPVPGCAGGRPKASRAGAGLEAGSSRGEPRKEGWHNPEATPQCDLLKPPKPKLVHSGKRSMNVAGVQ